MFLIPLYRNHLAPKIRESKKVITEAERKAKEEAQEKAEQAAKNLLPGLPGRR